MKLQFLTLVDFSCLEFWWACHGQNLGREGNFFFLVDFSCLELKELSSQSFCDSRNDYLSLSLSSAPRLSLSVCPAIKAYISVTMGWILMKLGESVGT